VCMLSFYVHFTGIVKDTNRMSVTLIYRTLLIVPFLFYFATIIATKDFQTVFDSSNKINSRAEIALHPIIYQFIIILVLLYICVSIAVLLWGKHRTESLKKKKAIQSLLYGLLFLLCWVFSAYPARSHTSLHRNVSILPRRYPVGVQHPLGYE
jgi:hypothetical protein